MRFQQAPLFSAHPPNKRHSFPSLKIHKFLTSATQFLPIPAGARPEKKIEVNPSRESKIQVIPANNLQLSIPNSGSVVSK